MRKWREKGGAPAHAAAWDHVVW